MRKKLYLSLCCVCGISNGYAVERTDTFASKPLFLEDLSLPEIIRQDQRLSDLKQQLDTQAVIQPIATNLFEKQALIVEEDPCFDIQKIVVDVDDSHPKIADAFLFLTKTLNKKSNLIVGQCIGTQSLQNVVRFAQNELMKKGFVTSQIVVPEQDMTEGTLYFQIVPGRIAQIIHEGSDLSKLQLKTALPFKQGDLLNIRLLDQALENLKKVSGLDVDIRIEATSTESAEGLSNILITTQSYKKMNISLSVDDSGNKSTGQYIGNIGISLNNPLRLNDSFNLNFSQLSMFSSCWLG